MTTEKQTNTALLLVDVQNDFMPGGTLAVPEGDEIVTPLNEMVKLARKLSWRIYASRDFHPEITVHFAKDGGIWPVHCVTGTEGAEFHPNLDLKDVVIINKGTKPTEDTEGLDVFNGHTIDGKSFTQKLAEDGVDEIYAGGLALDYCVKAGLLTAVDRGLRAHLLLDATKAVNLNPDDGKKALKELGQAGVDVTTTAAVIARFR